MQIMDLIYDAVQIPSILVLFIFITFIVLMCLFSDGTKEIFELITYVLFLFGSVMRCLVCSSVRNMCVTRGVFEVTTNYDALNRIMRSQLPKKLQTQAVGCDSSIRHCVKC